MINRGSLVPRLLTLAIAAALTGCSSDSTPAPSTSAASTTATPATSSSPSASPSPVLPAAAQQPTREGAEAFARYFFAVQDHAFQTNDSTALHAICASASSFCKSTIDEVDAHRRNNYRTEGGTTQVLAASASQLNREGRLVVVLMISQNAGRLLSANGQLVNTLPETKRLRVEMAMRWAEGRWTVLAVHVVKNGQ